MIELLKNNILDLTNTQPVRQGEERNIYEIASHPDVIIKTVRPDILNENGFFLNNNVLKNMRQLGCYRTKSREITEYLIQSRKRYSTVDYKLPIAHILGVIQTTEGIGLVSEKITDDRGNLAPTLTHLKDTGRLTAKHYETLNDFMKRAKKKHIVFSDIHPGNIVYTETRSGVPEFVCIDGFGEKAFIPIHRWSQRINNRKIDRIFNRMISYVFSED